MQALAAPCFIHHSTEANHPQSTRLVHTKRQAVLPASSLCPPLTRVQGAPGGAMDDGLLLGCSQASTFVEGSFCDEHDILVIQHQTQSFVSPLNSLSTFLRYIPFNKSQTAAARKDAISTATPISRLCGALDHDQPFTNQPSSNVELPKSRVLTQPLNINCNTMTTVVSAPGSPPDLTESRSSKSSSYCSQFSAENDLAEEITNFEDIGLDDDHEPERSHNDRNSHKFGGKIGSGGDKYPYHSSRQTTISTIEYQPKPSTSDGARKNAGFESMKRGFTSPSAVTLSSENSRPRSSSPPKRLPRSVTSFSVSHATSLGGVSPNSSLAPSRRGSWQPQRKTIREIEAEYHDSDDELPEDASLWNVPISPYLSHGASPRSSFRGSPERESAAKSPQPIPLDHSRSAPDSPPHNGPSSQPMPRHRLTPRPSSKSLSRSNPNSPRMPDHIRAGRAKSWNLAMADLSFEARIVSENLEYHADFSRNNGSDSSEKLTNNLWHRSSAPSAIQLPPIQRGALDFMPISKEKEAILSRTRPSWLPPKDPKEERKHLKEYQRMMAASIEAEKKRENTLKTLQCTEDTTRNSLNRIWDYYVNPTTDIALIDRRVHDLCWRGVTPRVRGKVWQRTVGNPLGLTSKTYHKALERAQAIKAKSSQDLGKQEKKMASWFADIERDAETAFPESNLFQRNGPLWQSLIDLCEAYTCYRSDIGYLYGTQLIGALLLTQITDPSEVFILMANCMNKPIPLAFQTSDVTSTQRAYNRVISNLGVKFPRLHDYLFESVERGGLGFTGEEVLGPMFRTLFSNGLDLDRLCRVWDIWVFEGDRTLIRAAVAVLGSLQSQIFDVAGDLHLKRRNIQEMLGWGPFNRDGKGSYWKLAHLGSEEAFVDEIDAAGKLDYTGH